MSELEAVASPTAWLTVVAAACLAAGKPIPWVSPARCARRWYRLARGRLHLGLACALVAWVALVNLVLMLGAEPNSLDAMFYHLARVGYYIQQGSFDAYGANFFSQDELGRNSSVLLSAILVLSDKSDLLAGLPQFTAWLVTGAAIHSIARSYRFRPSAAAFAGLTWMLFTVAWLEATTAQNDLLIAAHLASALTFLRWYRDRPRLVFLILAGVGVGLGVGTKASALVALPGLALAAGPRLWRPRVVAVGLAAALPFTLPAGMLDNWRIHGHPLGSKTLTEHVFLDRSSEGRLSSGAYNALRFMFDFLTLDQVPLTEGVARALARGKTVVLDALEEAGVDLRRKTDTRFDFSGTRVYRPDENLSYFGPLALLFFAGLVAGFWRRDLRWTTIGFAAFFLLECFVGPFDSTRGRQFMVGAALAMPGLAWLATRWRRRADALAAAFILATAVYIVPATLFRNNYFFFHHAGRAAFWSKDRVEQMAGFHRTYPALRKFSELVPPDARVGVGMSGYEYVLFGERLSRTLVPVLKKLRAGQPVPEDIDWLIYQGSATSSRAGDIDLGVGLFLRDMRANDPSARAAAQP